MRTLVFCAGLALAAPAWAATLVELTDFDYPAGGSDAVSNGFSYQQSAAYAGPDALYLHDDGGLLRSEFRAVSGARFDAVEADIGAYSNAYVTGAGRPPEDFGGLEAWAYSRKHAFDNFAWYGYRDGALVASHEGALDAPGEFRRFAFGETFRDLDSLEARVLLPGAPSFFFSDLARPETVWCDAYCAGFQVDRLALRVEVAPVPLPPAGLLLLGGLGLMAACRRLARPAG